MNQKKPNSYQSSLKLDILYFLGVSGAVYLFWLGFLVLIGSDMIYVHIHSRTESVIALWLAAAIWGGIAGYIKLNKEKGQKADEQNLEQWKLMQEQRIQNLIQSKEMN